MPNPIKYSTGTESLALKKGNYYIGTGDVGKGPTSSTGYYNGISPPSGGYTIYLNKETGGPSIYIASNDTQLISLTNSIVGTSYTTVNQCLVYFAGQTDKMVLNRNYDPIVTDGLIANFDDGFTPSYPKSGITWYNIRGTINATLYNGTEYDDGKMVYDGTNDYVYLGTDFAYNVETNDSFECIFKTTSTSATITAGAEGFRRRVVSLNTNNNTIFYRYFNAYSAFEMTINITGLTIQTNTTYIFCCTISSTNVTTFYINGAQVAQLVPPFGPGTSVTSGSRTYGFPIGFIGGPAGAFDGEYYKLSIYGKGLTEQEVLQNYNAQKGRFGL
jgi:hypothetical protein